MRTLAEIKALVGTPHALTAAELRAEADERAQLDGRLSGRWYEELTELSRMAIDRLIADGERLAR